VPISQELFPRTTAHSLQTTIQVSVTTHFAIDVRPAVHTSLLILAGGRATRLGNTRKPLLEIGGRPILARVLDALGPLADEWLALVQDRDLPPIECLQVVVDATPHAGVLPALVHGLQTACGEVCMIVAADMPFVKRSAFEYLLRVQRDERASIVIPRLDGFLQPMHAVVDRQLALQAVEAALVRGEQRLFRVLEPMGPRIVEEAELRSVDPDLLTLFNVNTPDDVARAERIAYRGVA
jgi:molybdopterin-guanine dinucleotide biosynthesis protein A